MSIASVINKAEIQLYSTLISVMSGINQLKTEDPQPAKSTLEKLPAVETAPVQIYEDLSSEPVPSIWSSIQQVFLSLLFWTVLGFAAGFLIGMLHAG